MKMANIIAIRIEVSSTHLVAYISSTNLDPPHYIYACLHIYVCINIFIVICIHLCIYIYLVAWTSSTIQYIYTYVYIYIYVYMYT
jgi:hypothetical protein